MSEVILVVVVAMCFAWYALFECLTLLVRAAAAELHQNAAGGAYEKIMSTFKRLAMFMYPPLLGFIILKQNTSALLAAILLSFSVAAIVVIFCIAYRMALLGLCRNVLHEFRKGTSAGASLLQGMWQGAPDVVVAARSRRMIITACGAAKRDPQLFFAATWVSLVYSSAIFFMNLLAMKFADSAVILLQMLGLVNGLGTILLAFVVDPLIARYLDKATRLDTLVVNVLTAQLCVYICLAPLLFICLFWLVL